LTATVGNLPLSVAIVTMGFSDTTFGPYALPLDLGFLGMPNCILRSAPETIVFVPGAGGSATFSLAVPNLNSMRGLVFFQQAAAIDPAANPLGVTLTNAVRGVVGTK
jgi:hypothetical protein